MLIRADAVFVTGPETEHADYDLTHDVTFHICDVSERSSAIVFDDADTEPAQVSVTCEGDDLHVHTVGFTGQNKVLYGGKMYDMQGDQLVLPLQK